ncbi:Helicase C-terminal [Penicillium canariense]|uniref:Helicase C-terminal n=1 Tax=Penicillium canariense TaxID=189055 RepID=A0A9W9IE69_9EURO|nr:Helicase C-terminal [Penicillium canariense]KAJ5175560.1 Helicase C-terminal [Penicillium canariense]
MANDIVLTTYDTLRSEWSTSRSDSVLYHNHSGWARIVLDEDRKVLANLLMIVKKAHHIRSRSSQIFQATCDLRARYRWCLTGTPIHNTLDDYAALLAFIRVAPFTGPSGKLAFANLIDSPLHSFDKHEIGIRRLRKLIAATCLRRTKDHVQDQLRLPSRIEKVHYIDLTHEERRIYDFFKSRASSLVGNLSQKSHMDKTSWSTMLSIIGFLRLICNHGGQLLPQAAIEMYNKQNPSAVHPLSKITRPSEVSTCPSGLSIDSLPGSPESLMPFDNLGRTDYQPSSKVSALIGNILSEQLVNKSISEGIPVKSVIFSFWTKMLDLIEIALRKNGIFFQRIDGKTSVGHRSLVLKRFNEDLNCTVILASIGAVAEGVDLTAASSVHLVEPQWNPMVEAQAVDRVHRIGQCRSVTVTRYIVKDSIENYVQGIQQAKLRFVQQSFGDTNTDQESLKNARLQVSILIR